MQTTRHEIHFLQKNTVLKALLFEGLLSKETLVFKAFFYFTKSFYVEFSKCVSLSVILNNWHENLTFIACDFCAFHAIKLLWYWPKYNDMTSLSREHTKTNEDLSAVEIL